MKREERELARQFIKLAKALTTVGGGKVVAWVHPDGRVSLRPYRMDTGERSFDDFWRECIEPDNDIKVGGTDD